MQPPDDQDDDIGPRSFLQNARESIRDRLAMMLESLLRDLRLTAIIVALYALLFLAGWILLRVLAAWRDAS